MPNTIQHKRKSTSGSVPSAANLAEGELAINTADARLYAKKFDGTVVNLAVTSIAGQDIAPSSVPLAAIPTRVRVSTNVYLWATYR